MLLLAAAVYDLPTGTVSLCPADSCCRLSTYGCQAFDYAGPTVWNSLPDELRNSDSFDSFVGIFTLLIIAFFAHCTCFLYFELITLVTIGGQH